MVGTPAYMAPEQVVGGKIDHRSDIYSLGALAYELLAGVPPFAGSNQDVIAAQLTRLPEPLSRRRRDTPPALAALVARCLQKQSSERWQSAMRFAQPWVKWRRAARMCASERIHAG
jgi:serine/threonine-protein kinase